MFLIYLLGDIYFYTYTSLSPYFFLIPILINKDKKYYLMFIFFLDLFLIHSYLRFFLINVILILLNNLIKLPQKTFLNYLFKFHLFYFICCLFLKPTFSLINYFLTLSIALFSYKKFLD